MASHVREPGRVRRERSFADVLFEMHTRDVCRPETCQYTCSCTIPWVYAHMNLPRNVMLTFPEKRRPIHSRVKERPQEFDCLVVVEPRMLVEAVSISPSRTFLRSYVFGRVV